MSRLPNWSISTKWRAQYCWLSRAHSLFSLSLSHPPLLCECTSLTPLLRTLQRVLLLLSFPWALKQFKWLILSEAQSLRCAQWHKLPRGIAPVDHYITINQILGISGSVRLLFSISIVWRLAAVLSVIWLSVGRQLDACDTFLNHSTFITSRRWPQIPLSISFLREWKIK